VTEGIANAYIRLGKLLEKHGHVDKAKVSLEKAEKHG
jgi:hypothetical protein